MLIPFHDNSLSFVFLFIVPFGCSTAAQQHSAVTDCFIAVSDLHSLYIEILNKNEMKLGYFF